MGIPYAEVIGDPIAHSKSPLIHNFWLKKLGIQAEYKATRVAAAELQGYFEHRQADPDWRGCNLTMPLKTIAVPLLKHSFPTVRAAGAVNTVFRCEDELIGSNTDLRGTAEPFRDGFGERGSALVIGSGGAARAAYVCLAALGFEPIRVMARTVNRSFPTYQDLMKFGNWLPLTDSLPPAHLVVNATPIGMIGGPSHDFDLSRLPPNAIIYDVVYDPLETRLLAEARRRGLRTIDGLTMLVGQAAHAFVHFFDGDPPREHDAELRELLTR